MQATLYFKVDSSGIRGDGSRNLWHIQNPMDNINVNFFEIKNYSNILDGHFIRSRVDYMGSGMEKRVIYANTIKIDGIIGCKKCPLTAAQHEQNITPQDIIQHMQHIKKQISRHKKLAVVCSNIFMEYLLYLQWYIMIYKIIFSHVFIKI
eukprot:418213_1